MTHHDKMTHARCNFGNTMHKCLFLDVGEKSMKMAKIENQHVDEFVVIVGSGF